MAAFDLRHWSLLLAGVFTLASAFGFALVVRLACPPGRVVRGRKLLTDAAARRAFAQASNAECKLSGTGIEVLPGLAVSHERETLHWLIWGSAGAGKTQTMLHLILAAIARVDGVLVLDVKGDMTAGPPGEPLLVAPRDQRSLVWDVARIAAPSRTRVSGPPGSFPGATIPSGRRRTRRPRGVRCRLTSDQVGALVLARSARNGDLRCRRGHVHDHVTDAERPNNPIIFAEQVCVPSSYF